jgi:hypothetical protein
MKGIPEVVWNMFKTISIYFPINQFEKACRIKRDLNMVFEVIKGVIDSEIDIEIYKPFL